MSLLYKSSDSRKCVINKVSLETLYDHFKNLNNTNADEDDLPFDIQNSDANVNFELNRSFTEDDISRAVKSLKNIKVVVMT